MKRAIAICLALAALAATADTNELEQLRVRFQEARKAYMDARKAAGLAKAAPRKVAPRTTATTFTKSQKRFFENRRYCVSRDTTTVPGSVITTWHRNGKPDTKGPAVVTNVLHAVVGVAQNNPLQARIETLSAEYRAAVERYASAEARVARMDALREWLAEQRDKALLETTRKFYQAVIDRLDGAQP